MKLSATALRELLLSNSADDVACGLTHLANEANGAIRRAAWERAARAFFQSATNGRPSIDDAALLGEVAMLLSSGKASTLHSALSKVARRAAGMSPSASTYERLRRKWKLQASSIEDTPGVVKSLGPFDPGPAATIQTHKAQIKD